MRWSGATIVILRWKDQVLTRATGTLRGRFQWGRWWGCTSTPAGWEARRPQSLCSGAGGSRATAAAGWTDPQTLRDTTSSDSLTADRAQTLAETGDERIHTEEHGNVELILPIDSSFDHHNVDGVQHGPSQRPQRAYINISKSQRSQWRCERVADNFLLPWLPMTPFSSGLSMLEKLTRVTPPMLKERERHK